MQHVIKVLHTETANNIYQFGLRITAKTNYEQREERKQELIYFMKQKLIGIILIVLGVSPAIYTKSILALLCFSFVWIIGFAVLVTKERVVG